MSKLADQREARTRARAEFNRRLALAKIDLSPVVLKHRFVVEAQRTSLAAAQHVVEIANDSRGIVAATVAALMLWLARKPVMAGAGKLLNRYQSRKAIPPSIGKRLKLLMADYWQKLKDYADE